MRALKTLAWCIIVCMLMSIASPILAYANTGTTVISYNGTEIAPAITPYSNELGIMADAGDLADLFSIEYNANSSAKYLHLKTEKHGDIFLVHNATIFSSGGNEFACAPYFYYENGVPMIEVGFFCEMFDAEYKISGSEIVISDKPVTEPEEKEYDGLELLSLKEFEATGTGELAGTIYYNTGAPEGGLEVEIIFAKYSMSTFISTHKAATIKLSKGETQKTFSIDPHDILGNDDTLNFAVGYNIPKLGMSGYLDYNDKWQNLSPETCTARDLSRFFLYHKNRITLDLSPKATISGTLSFDKDVAAPSTGLDVTLNLIAFSEVRKTNYGHSYRSYGGHYEIGTVYFNANEKTKKYAFNLPCDYESENYPYYVLFYSTDTRDCIYSPAYMKTDEKCEILSYYYDCPDNAKIFSSETDNKANLKLLTCKSYGELITGKAGDDIKWSFNEYDGALTLTGKGSLYSRLYYTEWRNFRTQIKTVTIGSGITSIGENTFANLINLESVTIPSSVRTIETQAFRNCSSLTSVELPQYITRVESWAFSNCNSLETLYLPGSINHNTMGTQVFSGCSNLESIYAPGKLAGSQSTWLGNNNIPVYYDKCVVTYKVNGRTTKTQEVEPGTVLQINQSPAADGSEYHLIVNGKTHIWNTVTVNQDIVIDEVYISPSSEVSGVVKCNTFDKATVADSYSYMFETETAKEDSAQNKTAIVALYDTIGTLVGIHRMAFKDGMISGVIIGEDAASFKILVIDDQSLKPAAFGCEGNLN